MIRFKSLIVQNFLSYGAVPTTVQLDRSGTTLLLGEDLDNTASGAGANGVGKTALLNALVYALYDKPISNISKDNLINNINKKKMSVTVEFEKDGHTYVVSRNRKMKAGTAGNFAKLFIDGEDKTPAKDINDEIVRIIGIPFELFIRIVAVSATHVPFLDLPSRHPTQPNQTDITEELFQLKTLSEKAVLLKEQIKGTEQSLKIHEEKAALLDKERERHEKQLGSARERVERWEHSQQLHITELTRQIATLQNIDIEAQKQLHKDIEILEDTIHQYSVAKDNWSATEKQFKKDKEAAEHELKHLIGGTCPYCKQSFGSSEHDRNTLRLNIAAITDETNKAKAEVTRLTEALKTAMSQYRELKAQLLVSDIDELQKLDSHIQVCSTQIKDAQSTVNPHIDALRELESVKLEKKDVTTINALKKTLEHQTFLLKLLTKKDSFVRKALLNKNIPFLNQRLQTYLTDLGLPHTVEFTHEMSAKITQFGHEMDFGNLSNGQRARVNLALSFAFRDVLQSMHDYVNICLLDEVLDVGLDTIGVQAAARMLKQKARNEKLALYIISHRDEIDSAFDHKMIVQMSGGFSSVRYENE